METINPVIDAAYSSELIDILYNDENYLAENNRGEDEQNFYKEKITRLINDIGKKIEVTNSANNELNKWLKNLHLILGVKSVNWRTFLADFNYFGLIHGNTRKEKLEQEMILARNVFHHDICQMEIKPAEPFFNVLVCDDLFIYSLKLFIILEKYFHKSGISKPVIHFDFEYDPQNVEKRCREKKYDLILLDIDFSILGGNENPAQKIAKWAHIQDPAIPIIVSSKYNDVNYYKELLNNVIDVMSKKDIRDKINKCGENEDKIDDVVLKEFLYPILRKLVEYYKLSVFHYERQTIFQFKPKSNFIKAGIFDRIEFDENIVELPKTIKGMNSKKIRQILAGNYGADKDIMYEYILIPQINKSGKLDLIFITKLPDIKDPSMNSKIWERLKNYNFTSDNCTLNKPKVTKIRDGEAAVNYEILLYNIQESINTGNIWKGLEKGNLVTCLMKDLEYLVISEFNIMSLLDIIGPIMIGPSSSHTAGANRIGRLARNFGTSLLQYFKFDEIEVVMLNSYDKIGDGHGSNKAVASGLAGLPQYSKLLPEILENPGRNNRDDSNVIKSKQMIRDTIYEGFSNKKGYITIKGQDIRIKFRWNNASEPDLHNNSIRFIYKKSKTDSEGSTNRFILEAQSWGGGNVQIYSIKRGNGKALSVITNNISEEFDFSTEVLKNKRHLYNGKDNIKIYDRTDNKKFVIDKIYDDPLNEVIKAIEELNLNKEKVNAELTEFSPEKDWEPNFISMDDLEKVGKNKWLWEIALNYENWYNNKSDNKYGVKKIYKIFVYYTSLILDLGKKYISEPTTTEGFKRNDALFLINNNLDLDLSTRAMLYAIAVNEANAKFMQILAAPTAGSCGVIPGILGAMNEYLLTLEFYNDKATRYKLLTEGLLISALVGLVITNVVPPAGATHGCQAEIGTAGAMASSLCAYIYCRINGNTQEKTAVAITNAAAISLKTSLGLVCDPIGGKVENPCIKRAGMKAAEAIQIGRAASKGLISEVSPSNVISAMKEVGENMSVIYKETSQGGLASTLISRTIVQN
jgi:L-serine deaminase